MKDLGSCYVLLIFIAITNAFQNILKEANR